MKYGVFSNCSGNEWSTQKLQIWHCPSERPHSHKDLPGGSTVLEWCDYGVNVHTNGFKAPNGWNLLTKVKKTAMRSLLADTSWYQTSDPTIKNYAGPYYGIAGGHYTAFESLAPRHSGMMNFVFHDGHGEKVKFLSIPSGSTQKIQSEDFYEQGNDGVANKQVPYPY